MKERLEFGTDGVRGEANEYPMTAEVALKLGVCFASLLKEKKSRPKLIIAKDTRISSAMLEHGLISGLASSGCDCIKLNIFPTPGVPYYILAQNADGGCVVSGSHNIFSENGIKFFNYDGSKLPDEDEEKIEKMINNDNIPWSYPKGADIGRVKELRGAVEAYIDFLKDTTASCSLKGLKIGVDCSNGSNYHIVPTVLRELQAEVYPINIVPDGININEDLLNINKLRRLVREEKIDAGFIFDGDGDRVIAVDEKGNIVDGDYILAIMANYLKRTNRLTNNVVVTTVMANYGFIEAMKKLDINVITTPVGDKHVVKKMQEEEAILGGEQSGHIIFFDYLPTGDGAITMLQLLSVMKEQDSKLSTLTKIMQKYPQVLINQKVSKKEPFPEELTNKIKQVEQRLSGEGRVVVRYSGTEPLIRIMVEGRDKKLINSLAEEIRTTIEACQL